MYSALLRTVNFAAAKHRDQRRNDLPKSPYINHPINVATLLSEVGKIDDVVTLQAALLHDTVEDTNTTFEELEAEFGVEVTNVVREVTDDKSLPKVQRKMLQIEHSPHMSPRAKLVKLADKLHNLSDEPPLSWDAPRVQGYYVWAYHVVAGLRGTNAPLEAALDMFFASSFYRDSQLYPCLPSGDLGVALEEYLTSLK